MESQKIRFGPVQFGDFSPGTVIGYCRSAKYLCTTKIVVVIDSCTAFVFCILYCVFSLFSSATVAVCNSCVDWRELQQYKDTLLDWYFFSLLLYCKKLFHLDNSILYFVYCIFIAAPLLWKFNFVFWILYIHCCTPVILCDIANKINFVFCIFYLLL